MAQFRVTQKFATDYKINSLLEPHETVSFLDDWFIDVMRIQRKKVAIVAHAKTLLTFLIPYTRVGGAKNIPEYISALLQQFLCDRNFPDYVDEVKSLFSEPSIFCKTKSRHILGHMNDFKYCIGAKAYEIPFDAINWDKLMDANNNMPINVKTIGYTTAFELMGQLLKNNFL